MPKHPKNVTEHNYFRKVKDLVEQGLPAGEVTHVTVLHDDWCGIFRGEACNCNPVLTKVAPKHS